MALLWIETSPGNWERPMATPEVSQASFVDNAKEREPLRIQAWAEITAPYNTGTITETFGYAWKALRLLKSPDIATTFQDDKKCYKAANQAELDKWTSETYFSQHGKAIDDVIAESHNVLDPRPQLHLISQDPPRADAFKGYLLLLISHWRTEASGAYIMLDQLLDYANELMTGEATRTALEKHNFGSEAKLLTPVAEDIWMPNKTTSPEAAGRVAAHFQRYFNSLPGIDFPITGDVSALPTNDGALQRVYSAATTRTIIAACKKVGVTVTSAIHSAYLGAVWSVAPADRKSLAYASLMPAQVRKRLPAESPYRTNGAWDAARMLMLAVPSGLSFLDRAASLSKQYATANTDTWLRADLREVTRQASEMFKRTDLHSPVSPSSPWFTSFGVLDPDVIKSEHGRFQVERVAAWADNVGPGIVLTVWTFKGQLTSQISWNLAYHTRDQIKNVLDLMDEEVKAGFGIEVGIDETRGWNRRY